MKLPKHTNIAVFITNQNHPIQKESLPKNAIPGFVVSVFRTDKEGKPKGKAIESFWTKWKEQAESMAQEYHRQYGIMAAFNWN